MIKPTKAYLGTAVIPTGVRKPKEKAVVERTVKIISTWKTAAVLINYHIAVDKMNYSAPYEYIKYTQ